MVSAPRAPTRASRSGTRSTTITRTPSRSAMRVAMSPIGPAPMITSVSSAPTSAYRTACQAVGMTSERKTNRSSERALGHLDRQEVGELHAQQLGLAAGHRAVETAVAQQAGAGALVGVLGGLALAVQAAVAHPAPAAADVERDDDPVADLQVEDVGTDLLDDAHRLVTDDVAGVHERRERLVEVQVRAAQPGGGDADDRVGGVDDRGVGDVLDADVARALPGHCLHVCMPPRSGGGGPSCAADIATDGRWAGGRTSPPAGGQSPPGARISPRCRGRDHLCG